jgi:hypothetical protein
MEARFKPRIIRLPNRHKYRLLLGIFCGCFFAAPKLSAEIIINDEHLLLHAKDGFFTSLDLDIDFESGNTYYLETEILGILGYCKRPHQISFFVGIDNLIEKEEEDIIRNYGQIRYNYIFNERWQTFSFYQIQNNSSQILKQRQLLGTGIRYRSPIVDSSHIDLGTGLMLEKDNLDITKLPSGYESEIRSLRMVNFISAFHHFSKTVKIINTLHFQPNVRSLKDFRAFNETTNIIQLSKHLEMNISLIWMYDNQPPRTIGKHDLQMDVGIILSF